MSKPKPPPYQSSVYNRGIPRTGRPMRLPSIVSNTGDSTPAPMPQTARRPSVTQMLAAVYADAGSGSIPVKTRHGEQRKEGVKISSIPQKEEKNGNATEHDEYARFALSKLIEEMERRCGSREAGLATVQRAMDSFAHTDGFQNNNSEAVERAGSPPPPQQAEVPPAPTDGTQQLVESTVTKDHPKEVTVLTRYATKLPQGSGQVPPDDFDELVQDEFITDLRELEVLKNLDFFVLDNSLRETTVATLRGHTLENKKQILQAVRGCNFHDIILGTYNSNTERVDDALPQAWRQWGESMDGVWGFCNIFSICAPPSEQPGCPGLEAMISYGFCNAILEVDMTSPGMDYESFDLAEHCKKFIIVAMDSLAKRRCDGKSRVLVNLRDFPAWLDHESGFRRTLGMVKMMAELPEQYRPLGILFEEPGGLLLPETVGVYSRILRKTMTKYGWANGRLMFHGHANFGNCDAAMLKALANGCDGLWGAVCRPGAQLGHACSSVALVNLARLGNTTASTRYNIPKIIQAARRVHEIATARPCDTLQEVYGTQAFDMVFGSGPMSTDDVMRAIGSKICGAKTFVRVQMFSSADMINEALTERFGPSDVIGWNPELCASMKVILMKELVGGKRWEFNTNIGLCQLYQYAAEQADELVPLRMLEIASQDVPERHPLLLEVRHRFLEIAEYERWKQQHHDHDTRKNAGSLQISGIRMEQSTFIVPQEKTQQASLTEQSSTSITESSDQKDLSSCNMSASQELSFVVERRNFFKSTAVQKGAVDDSPRCGTCGVWAPKLFRSTFAHVPDDKMPAVPTRKFLKALFEGRPAFFEKALEHVPLKYKNGIPWSDAKFLLRWSLAQAGLDAFADVESLLRYAASAVLNKYIEGFFAPPEVYMISGSSLTIAKEEKMDTAMKKARSVMSITSKGSSMFTR